MPTFTLVIGSALGGFQEVLARPSKGRKLGDGFLLIEQPLIDPKTNKQVGTLIASVKYMRLSHSGDPLLYFGNANHHLDDGVISVQGHWLETETKPVFPIIGGTGDYKLARGTVTYETAIPQFTYDVKN
jgi:hypothetical protein